MGQGLSVFSTGNTEWPEFVKSAKCTQGYEITHGFVRIAVLYRLYNIAYIKGLEFFEKVGSITRTKLSVITKGATPRDYAMV